MVYQCQWMLNETKWAVYLYLHDGNLCSREVKQRCRILCEMSLSLAGETREKQSSHAVSLASRPSVTQYRSLAVHDPCWGRVYDWRRDLPYCTHHNSWMIEVSFPTHVLFAFGLRNTMIFLGLSYSPAFCSPYTCRHDDRPVGMVYEFNSR